MDLKQYLKTLKMNESRISAIVGGLIIAVIAIMVFNYFRNINPGVTTPTSVSTESTPVAAQTYTVEAGDSLWSVAQDQLGDGYRWTELAEANNIDITTSNHLNKGQQLIIPTGDEPATIAQGTIRPTVQSSSAPQATIAATPTTIASPSPAATIDNVDHETVITGENYTVIKGDNLWTIAEKAYGDGFQWTKIAEANKLDNPSIIHTGNSLTLPR